REGLRLMSRSGGGSIVNVASVAGLAGIEGQLNYAASKGAVIAFTRGLAREAAPFGVRANAVAPGFVETDMVARIPKPILDMMLHMSALKRAGKPHEVAHLVTFLPAERASVLTGKVSE